MHTNKNQWNIEEKRLIFRNMDHNPQHDSTPQTEAKDRANPSTASQSKEKPLNIEKEREHAQNVLDEFKKDGWEIRGMNATLRGLDKKLVLKLFLEKNNLSALLGKKDSSAGEIQKARKALVDYMREIEVRVADNFLKDRIENPSEFERDSKNIEAWNSQLRDVTKLYESNPTSKEWEIDPKIRTAILKEKEGEKGTFDVVLNGTTIATVQVVKVSESLYIMATLNNGETVSFNWIKDFLRKGLHRIIERYNESDRMQPEQNNLVSFDVAKDYGKQILLPGSMYLQLDQHDKDFIMSLSEEYLKEGKYVSSLMLEYDAVKWGPLLTGEITLPGYGGGRSARNVQFKTEQRRIALPTTIDGIQKKNDQEYLLYEKSKPVGSIFIKESKDKLELRVTLSGKPDEVYVLKPR